MVNSHSIRRLSTASAPKIARKCCPVIIVCNFKNVLCSNGCFYRNTKEVPYKTLVWPKLEYAAPIFSPHSKLQINQIEKIQRTAAHWTCRRWRNTSSVDEMLDELEWPSLEARRDRSYLLLFLKIHCGAVSIEKYK